MSDGLAQTLCDECPLVFHKVLTDIEPVLDIDNLFTPSPTVPDPIEAFRTVLVMNRLLTGKFQLSGAADHPMPDLDEHISATLCKLRGVARTQSARLKHEIQTTTEVCFAAF